MSLLNPALLVGLAALAIPIIVHFLNRRRFRRVPWAAMRFLQVSLERNRRRMQVEDWILLAIRLLLIGLIVLAFARPALEKFGLLPALSGGVASAVIVDSSASMQRTDRGSAGTRFEAARAAAGQALGSLPAGSSASFDLAADTAPPVAPSGDVERLIAALEQAEPTDRGSDLSPAVDAAIASLASRTATARELVLVTDGDASAWREFEAIVRSLEAAGDEVRTIIALVGGAPGENLALTRLEQSSALAAAGSPLRLSIEVENTGSEDAEDVLVSLEIDSQPAGEPTSLGTIPAGESRSAPVFVRLPGAGFHRITAALAGGDASPADDLRSLVVRAVTREKALLVDGRPGRDPGDSATFFLRNALVPVPSSDADSYHIASATVTANALDSTELDDYRAVFLADVSELSDASVAKLSDFVQAGGGLAVFPGDNLERSFYNNSLHTKLGLLPAAYGDVVEAPPALASSGGGHPLSAIWDRESGGSLSEITVSNALPLELPQDSTAAVVFRFGDGSPAFVESRYGGGRVYQSAIAADTAWGDFPVRPVFLPLVQQLFGDIVSGRDAGLNLVTGDAFTRTGPAEWAGQNATVYAVGAGTSIGKMVAVTAEGDGARMSYSATDRAGSYELALSKPLVSFPFAVNPIPRESDPAPLTPAQLDRLRGLAEVVEISEGADLQEALGRKRSGAELWPLLLLAAALLACLELFLAQHFSREK